MSTQAPSESTIRNNQFRLLPGPHRFSIVFSFKITHLGILRAQVKVGPGVEHGVLDQTANEWNHSPRLEIFPELVYHKIDYFHRLQALCNLTKRLKLQLRLLKQLYKLQL